jgi:S-formylglutathione hydrolase FrmB
MASGVKRAVGAGLVGLFVISLIVARDPLLGRAFDRGTPGDGAPLGQAAPQPAQPGDENATPGTTPTAEPVAPAAPVAPPAPVAPIAPVAAQPAGSRIVAATFYSPAMRTQRSYEIYLPPSYQQATDRTYPVLYLLHGDGGSAGDWAAFGLQAKMDQTIAAGGPEIIVVMPDGSGHSGDLTDWANRWDGSDPVEDQVLDLVSFVDQNYRTVPDRSARFIGGLSSGGFGALNIALHHQELFSTAMSFSGFIAASDPEADPGVFGEDPGFLERNSPQALVTSQAGAGNIYYVLSGGQGDWYFQHRMAEFSAELDRLGIAHEFHVVPGRHDMIAWDAGLDFGLARLAAQLRDLSGPTPSSSE